MPLTIGTLTSNVDIVDSGGMLTVEVMERIVATVLERVRQERMAEERSRSEREIRDRMTDPAI